MRQAAISALGKYFRYQPDLFDTYYQVAVNDQFKRLEDLIDKAKNNEITK
ncbi:hypothetical protein [Anabaena azotica]